MNLPVRWSRLTRAVGAPTGGLAFVRIAQDLAVTGAKPRGRYSSVGLHVVGAVLARALDERGLVDARRSGTWPELTALSG